MLDFGTIFNNIYWVAETALGYAAVEIFGGTNFEVFGKSFSWSDQKRYMVKDAPKRSLSSKIKGWSIWASFWNFLSYLSENKVNIFIYVIATLLVLLILKYLFRAFSKNKAKRNTTKRKVRRISKVRRRVRLLGPVRR